MRTFNSATGALVWEGVETTPEEIEVKVKRSSFAFKEWSCTPLPDRISILEKYAAELSANQNLLAELISQETGKPLWESATEISAMIQKVPISIQALQERCREHQEILAGKQRLKTFFKPHGVIAVLGPFNFPGHLPNGHIVPALLAGNTVIFKPSEFTPTIAEQMRLCLEKAGIPRDVFQVVLGGPSAGKKLIACPEIDGIFFTGSASTGTLLNEQMAKNPGKILALELGGNNPLVVSQTLDIDAAVYTTIQSAFLTAGQRCSCARRLILPHSLSKEVFLNSLIKAVANLKVGFYTDHPEPFMGPLIHMNAALDLLAAQEKLVQLGATALLPIKILAQNKPLLSPGIIDVSAISDLPDEEYFGPLLQVISVPDFEEAIQAANRTRYGLTAGLISSSPEEWEQFSQHVEAGVINWNNPLTGASSRAPFGGIKMSGNHRPSAYFAADYCSYPVASMQSSLLKLPETLLPGVNL